MPALPQSRFAEYPSAACTTSWRRLRVRQGTWQVSGRFLPRSSALPAWESSRCSIAMGLFFFAQSYDRRLRPVRDAKKWFARNDEDCEHDEQRRSTFAAEARHLQPLTTFLSLESRANVE